MSALTNDDILLAVQLNLGAGVLAGDDLLALLDFHLDFLAVNNTARAYFDDFSNLGLLLCGCGRIMPLAVVSSASTIF